MSELTQAKGELVRSSIVTALVLTESPQTFEQLLERSDLSTYELGRVLNIFIQAGMAKHIPTKGWVAKIQTKTARELEEALEPAQRLVEAAFAEQEEHRSS